MKGHSPSEEALVAAERWFTRLREAECTPLERLEFERWRATPEHAQAYAATQRLWDSAGRLAASPQIQQLSERVLADSASPPDSRRKWIRLAASIFFALLTSGLWFIFTHNHTHTFAYSTAPGERTTVTLPDHSTIALNASTEVAVRFSHQARWLTLKHGEALFTVSPDPHRPFTVEAADGQITALATRFQVRRDGAGVTVTLVDGRVALDREAVHESAVLQPGEQVDFTVAERTLRRRSVDTDTLISWTSGRLRFHATPLQDALHEVNRYSTTELVVADPTLARHPISGTFALGDSTSVVAALQALLSVRAVPSDTGDPPRQITLTPPSP